MSLLKQLWITVIAASVIALLGSTAVSVITARDYLQQQLLAQSADAAAGLALSMSQQTLDPALAEALVTALFDSGHFERVAYADVQGRIVVERRSRAVPAWAPGWFVALVPLDAPPGVGLVSQKWSQAGQVTVVAHKRFAYDALWQGTLRLLAVMAVLAVVWGLVMNRLMRWVRRPIDAMVDQARAIGERRFITMSEPRVFELRAAVRALNLMVEQVRVMFGEQAARIEELRADANRDPLTGLPNRGYFLGRLRSDLSDESAPAGGALAVVRLADLAELNRRLGRERADAFIRHAAQVVQRMAGEHDEHLAARLNGADFAWLMAGALPAEIAPLLARLEQALEGLYHAGHTDRSPVASIGVAPFRRGDDPGSVMARADSALMRAERGEGGDAVVFDAGAPLVARTQDEWRQLLEGAVAARGFALATFPVTYIDGTPWHDEAMIRMHAPDDGTPWTAGQFMPAADRLGMTVKLDLLAVDLALQRALHGQGVIAVNLSPISLQSLEFREGLERLLRTAPTAARRLWVEVSERGLDQGLAGLAAVAPILSGFGCKLGIEHFGRHFSAIPRLYAQRIDYLKVDGGFVSGIEENAGNQRLVKAIADVARGLGIEVIAERVHTDAEWQVLAELGVAGVTGPAVTRRLQRRS